MAATARSKLAPALSQSIRERSLRRKQAAAALLNPTQLAAAKRIAKRKSIPYKTQVRLWIAEGIRRDSRTRQAAQRNTSAGT